jgi:hypothetical protein
LLLLLLLLLQRQPTLLLLLLQQQQLPLLLLLLHPGLAWTYPMVQSAMPLFGGRVCGCLQHCLLLLLLLAVVPRPTSCTTYVPH